MPAKFEVFRDEDGEHRFRFRAGSGEIVVQSERYPTVAKALGGVEMLRTEVRSAMVEHLE